MKKTLATLLSAFLVYQPYIVLAQERPAHLLAGEIFDGSIIERYQDGTALTKIDRTNFQEGVRVDARAVKEDPRDEFGVSWRWVPGQIFNKWTEIRHFQIVDRPLYGRTKATAAATQKATDEATLARNEADNSGWAVFGSIGLGAVAGVLVGLGLKYATRRPEAIIGGGLAAALITSLGVGIPWYRSAVRTAEAAYKVTYDRIYKETYDTEYQSALHHPATWTNSLPKEEPTGNFDVNPPLDSPAHPDRLAIARERKAAHEERLRAEEERRRAEEERRRAEEERRRREAEAWRTASYTFTVTEGNVNAVITLSELLEEKLFRRDGYVEVRFYAGDDPYNMPRILSHRQHRMNSWRNSFTIAGRSVCGSDSFSYYRYVKVRIFPRWSDGSLMQDYRNLRGAKLRVRCSRYLWDTYDSFEFLDDYLDE